MSFYNFLKKFAPEAGQMENKAGVAVNNIKEPLTNEVILNYITRYFERELKNNSFADIVTFPMSFTIIMNQKDFNRCKDYVKLIAKIAVERFYGIIRQEIKDGKTCENLATYWNICFIACDGQAVEVNENSVQVAEGELGMCCSVHDTVASINNDESNGSNFSVTMGGSEIYGNINFNRETIRNLRLVGETHFQMNWDPTLSTAEENRAQPAVGQVGTVVAKLYGQGYEFSIGENECRVSGSAETRRDKNIFRVENDFVTNGHIRIQYLKNSNKFKIAAFGETSVDGRPMVMSTPTDVKWIDLQDGADINLADEIIMTFKTLI